jgi:hypothetical protein
MKWLNFLFIFLFLISGVHAIGLSPARIDFGEVEPGRDYKTMVIVVNENLNEVSLNVERTLDWIKLGDFRIEGDTIRDVKVELKVPKTAKVGKYSEIVMLKKETGNKLSLGEGIGLKVNFEVVNGSSNKITGYSIADDAKGLGLWLYAGLAIIIGACVWIGVREKHRVQHIFSSLKCRRQKGTQGLNRRKRN